MTTVKWHLYCLILTHALLFGGCATTAQQAESIPTDIATFESTGKTIYVMPVTMRPNPKPGFLMNEPLRLDNETFHQVTVEMLRRTGLFSDVRTDNNADYTLATDIVGQRLIGSVSNVALLLVRYELRDATSNRETWSENIFSHFELSASQVFMGTERTRKVLEGASRDNMAQLGEKLGEILASPPRQNAKQARLGETEKRETHSRNTH
ncbi:MAG: hypothetical protein JSU95_05115 [Betaproteobacteria bacterium]|nr:MAG: hypothetical protein JSU95_05115 [Betaproteobacteria bacterium]